MELGKVHQIEKIESPQNCPRMQPLENAAMDEIRTIAWGFGGGRLTSSNRKAHPKRAGFEEVYSAKHRPTKQRRSESTLIVTFGEANEDGVL